MSELQADPEVLTGAAGSFSAERAAVARAGGAVSSALDCISAALPGTRTGRATDLAGTALSAAARSAVAELAALAVALAAAATEYAAVDRDTATGLERAGRRPA